MTILDNHLTQSAYLAPRSQPLPTFCYGDVAFAEVCAFDLKRWTNVAGWAQNIKALPGFKARMHGLYIAASSVRDLSLR